MYSAIRDPSKWVLPRVLSEMAERQPDRHWLLDADGASLTFGDAHVRSLQAASFLASCRVARGARVGVFLFSGCEFVVAWMGLGRLGATAVFLNTELRGGFLRHQLIDSGVTCVVADEALLPVLEEVAGEVPRLELIVSMGGGSTRTCAGTTVRDWDEYRSMPPASVADPVASDVACIMYTSGTSGPAKGVLMPHAHCALYGIGAIECLRLDSQDRYYVTLPLFHANGLLMQVGATLLAGIPAFVRRRFSATSWLSDIREQRSTVTNLLGSTAAFVVAQPPTAHDADHALRAVLNAPNLPAHEAIFRERFGVRDVVSGFGMTEVNTPIWGRVGSPAPGAAGWVHHEHFEAIIADPETDLPLPAGQMGEILVRPKVPFGFMAGYHEAPQKTVDAWRNLWFHTGDAGTVDDRGLFTFVDRIRDCIRRRGENISATEVEAVVMELPGVGEAAAFAVPSDIPGGEDEVMLALVPAPGARIDPAAIAGQAGERLPRFAKPRYVKIVDRLPKTATGKVQRAVLKQQGAQGAFDFEAGG